MTAADLITALSRVPHDAQIRIDDASDELSARCVLYSASVNVVIVCRINGGYAGLETLYQDRQP